MITNPIWFFDTQTETGINEVPLKAKVYIQDSDGFGTPREVTKIHQGLLNGGSTIQDFLQDPTLYDDITDAIPEMVKVDTTGTLSITNKIWNGTITEYNALGIYSPEVLYFMQE
jgi:hypothetical protein